MSTTETPSDGMIVRKRAQRRATTQPANPAPLFNGEPEEEAESNQHVLAMKGYETLQVNDPFETMYGATSAAGAQELTIQKPPFTMASLQKLPQENNTLRQCIDAYTVNIESFGYRLEYIGPEGEDESQEAEAEKEAIEELVDDPNGEYTFIDLRERVRRDIETFGLGYMEVGRNRDGAAVVIYHVPSQTMRITKKDPYPTETTKLLKRRGRVEQVKVKRHFRRYVQVVGTRTIYFKEPGDPRSIDPSTGRENNSLPFDQQANEIVCLSLHTPGHVYGLPRWINQLPSILGSRESELTNLQFFRDNAIPAMAVLVSGGALTGDTVSNIENQFSMRRGRESMNRILVMEATGDEEAASENGSIPPPRVDLKPLKQERQSDELFQNYDGNNQTKIRSSFRLPPIFIGKSEEYTRATAEASQVVAEAQVFGPERAKMDDVINRFILSVNGMQPQYWKFRSNPPRLSDPSAMVDALSSLNELGAMTPNTAIGIGNEMFNLDVPRVSEDWGDLPFPMVQQLLEQERLVGIENVSSKRGVDTGSGNDNEENPPNNQPTGTQRSNAEPSRYRIRRRSRK